MGETKRIKAEDNTLHTFCKELSKDVTKIQQDVVNMKGSYEGFHHSRCIVVNNLKPDGDDYRRTVQRLINEEIKLAGIEVFITKKTLIFDRIKYI